MMNILFVSTHNLATNPRLVKEVDLAIKLCYGVTLVCFDFDNWSKPLHDRILAGFGNKIAAHIIPGGRKPMLPWIVSSLLFKGAGYGLRMFPQNERLLSVRSNKRSWLLNRQLKKIHTVHDLIVAHNPGSFLPACRYAESKHTALGIDVEDYHPGETNDPLLSAQLKSLAKKVLPRANYITAASPLILSYTLEDCGMDPGRADLVLNYFPAGEFTLPQSIAASALKLCWFSQYISHGRGLEQVLPALVKCEGEAELHVYGKLDDQFYRDSLKDIPNIVIHDPLPQPLLHMELAKYDIGLALENIHSNLNRELCITNKILSYEQAGLYILASATKAQIDFMSQHKDAGELVALNEEALLAALKKLISTKDKIRSQKLARYQAAANSHWENESGKLKKLWSKTGA